MISLILKILRGYEEFYLLVYSAVYSVERQPTFRRNNQSVLLASYWFLGLLFNPEDGGVMFLRNVGGLSTDYTVLYPTKY
jgi:hypothetical protein